MLETDLRLEPNEASDLCPVLDAQEQAARGWDRAFATVLDEAAAVDCLAVLVHGAGAPLDDGWSAVRVRCEAHEAGRAEDAEACARRDGWLYVLGSQFGSKDGPLQAKRSWVARVREADLAGAVADGTPVRMELVRLRFALHRAVNDALAAAAVELLPVGPLTRERYVEATIARGEQGGKSWAGQVRPGDHPINVEAMAFRPDGRLVLGLRYPTTARGAPLLVELDDVAAVFAGAAPACSSVRWLEGVGAPERPVGVRALHATPGGELHAVLGNLDARGKGATVLEDHPEGAAATSVHVRFALPDLAATGPVAAQVVRDLGGRERVEGLALDADGHTHYVVDDEGSVALRSHPVDGV